MLLDVYVEWLCSSTIFSSDELLFSHNIVISLIPRPVVMFAGCWVYSLDRVKVLNVIQHPVDQHSIQTVSFRHQSFSKFEHPFIIRGHHPQNISHFVGGVLLSRCWRCNVSRSICNVLRCYIVEIYTSSMEHWFRVTMPFPICHSPQGCKNIEKADE